MSDASKDSGRDEVDAKTSEVDDLALTLERAPAQSNATRGHVMSSRGPASARSPNTTTIVGVGTIPPEIPSAPLTEVEPAHERRPTSAPTLEPPRRPRPSETMLGSQGPLETADEPNTAVAVGSLTAADAARILAVADSKDGPTSSAVSSRPLAALPPPPPLRRSAPPARPAPTLLFNDAQVGSKAEPPPQPISSSSLVEDPPSQPGAPAARLLDPPAPLGPPGASADARGAHGRLDHAGPTSERDPFVAGPLRPMVAPRRALPGPPGRVTAAVAGGVAVGIVAFVSAIVVAVKHAETPPAALAPPQATGASPPWTVAGTNVPVEVSPRGSPCLLAGAPHVLAPRALLRPGIEAGRSQDRIAVGVALGERDALVVSLDPATFVALDTARTRSRDLIHHVIPVLGPTSEVSAFLETSGSVESGRPVDDEPAFVIRVSDQKLTGSSPGGGQDLSLFALDSDAPVDAIRAAHMADGYVVAFRQGTSIFLGGLRQDRTAAGELVRVAGLGPQVGAPAIAAGTDHALIAWSDRADVAAPWQIRWVDWRRGTEATPTTFDVPPGGAGGQVMSPGLVSLAGGGFVMAWTEGLGARHEVRAQALDARGRGIGGALTVSADGVNAGQGTPALTPDGRGAIVFLASPAGGAASVIAAPIVCPGG